MSQTTQRRSTLIILALVALSVVQFWMNVRVSAERGTEALSAVASDNQSFEWRLVTSWPKNFPGLGTAPEVFAERVHAMSNGRLSIKVYAGGELVPSLGVFDAVSLGTAEMGHSAAYYWKGKIPSSIFFTAVPFGMTAQEMNGWLRHGGGMELWREVYAPYNLVPLAAGNTGVQMAGWFSKEIRSMNDIVGLKMRIPGVGGEVFKRAGGTALTLPGSELYTSLQTGVIDATEWVAPYNDSSLGLHEVAEYYYYPGWQEPGPTLELTVNKAAWESLPADLQAIVESAADTANADMLDLYTARNFEAMDQLQKGKTKIRPLPDDVLRALRTHAETHIAELVAEDPVAAKVYKSWKPFADNAKAYHRISEKAYLNARDL